MKWYKNFKGWIVTAVLACGLTSLILGIFLGKSIERRKCLKTLSSIESKLDSLESITKR